MIYSLGIAAIYALVYVVAPRLAEATLVLAFALLIVPAFAFEVRWWRRWRQ